MLLYNYLVMYAHTIRFKKFKLKKKQRSHLSELLHFTVRQLLGIDVVFDHPNSDPVHFKGILEEESKSYEDIQRNSEQVIPKENSSKHAQDCLLRTA